jgi:diacylglycerol kinase family enzyme
MIIGARPCVAIIGGGFTGTTIAVNLARDQRMAGWRIAVFEPRDRALRFLPMGDTTAAYWYFWFGRIVSLIGYTLAAIRVLASARPFSALIISGSGHVRVKTLQIAVGNGVHYGGGAVIHHDATIEDGHLDLYSLELKNVWKFGLMLGAFRRGEHGAWNEVRTVKDTEFDIRTRKPRPVNADGDIVTTTPAHFVIRPSAITVFAPA